MNSSLSQTPNATLVPNMSSHGDKKTSRVSPKSGGHAKGGVKHGSSMDNCPKSTPSLEQSPRFRQILKKHSSSDRSPARKRKVTPESDDEAADPSYDPSNDRMAPKTNMRKRSVRGGGGRRAKRQKMDVTAEGNQTGEKLAVAGVAVASAAAPMQEPGTKPRMQTKTDTETGVNSEAESEAERNINEVMDGFERTDGASPHKSTRGHALQGVRPGNAHLMVPGNGQTALPDNLNEPQIVRPQPRQPDMTAHLIGGNDPLTFIPQLNPRQLAALLAPQTSQLLPHQITPEQQQQRILRTQAQIQQFNRFQALQMFHTSGMDMPGNDLQSSRTTLGQFEEHFLAGFYRGAITLSEQIQLNHGVLYAAADNEELQGRVGDRYERDAGGNKVEREVTSESSKDSDCKGEHEDGGGHRHEHHE